MAKYHDTGKGGAEGYRMVRSKYLKGPDGYGKTITQARENLIAADPQHRDPGPDVVAAHVNPGVHQGSDQAAKWETRQWNSAEMGMRHDGHLSAADKLKLKQYEREKPKAKIKNVTEKLNARSRKSS